MNDFTSTTQASERLAPQRMEKTEPLLMVGMRDKLAENFAQEIPLLWQSFMQISHQIYNRTDEDYFGVCMKDNENPGGFYYMAGCAVNEFAQIPLQLSQVILPSCTYAVFTHRQHVSQLNNTVCAVFDKWLPASGYQLVQQPTHSVHHLERYSREFNPQTGLGGMEVWVPIHCS